MKGGSWSEKPRGMCEESRHEKEGGDGDSESTAVVGTCEGACVLVWRARRIGKRQIDGERERVVCVSQCERGMGENVGRNTGM